MLFLINKTRTGLPEEIGLLAGDEEPDVLLVGDAVHYASDFMVDQFRDMGVEEVYASKPCLDSRKVEVSERCTVVDHDKMVTLIMDDHEKTISL